MTEENKEPTVEERLTFLEKQNTDLMIMLLALAETVSIFAEALTQLKQQVVGTQKYGGVLN